MEIEKDHHLKSQHPATMLEAERLINQLEILMHDTQPTILLIKIHRVLCEMRMYILDNNDTK